MSGEKIEVDLIVSELMRYDVVAEVLQETKWFGCGTYEVGDSMVLTLGRSAPSEGQSVQRGEGVALVLRGQALAAWRLGGQQWKAWSSRCVCPQFCKWIKDHLAGYTWCPVMHPPEQQVGGTRMLSSRS